MRSTEVPHFDFTSAVFPPTLSLRSQQFVRDSIFHISEDSATEENTAGHVESRQCPVHEVVDRSIEGGVDRGHVFEPPTEQDDKVIATSARIGLSFRAQIRMYLQQVKNVGIIQFRVLLSRFFLHLGYYFLFLVPIVKVPGAVPCIVEVEF